MKKQINLLECKMCGYKAKSLHQHIKAIHKISSKEYRNIYGQNCILQIGFIPPASRPKINKKYSNYVKQGYKNQREKLKKIMNFYSKEETKKILLKNKKWKKYIGRTKQRTLLRDNVILYKSIYSYTDFIKNFIDKVPTLPQRLKFIVEYNYDIEKLKCGCKKTYTFNKYCRHCPDNGGDPTGTFHSEKTKRKIRLSTIRRIENRVRQCCPNYNPKACKLFEELNKKNNWSLQHAENGGEFYIKGLGYWVDAIDFKNKIIIEYDENHHFNTDGNLKEKDIWR